MASVGGKDVRPADIRGRALRALGKRSTYGVDVDVAKYLGVSKGKSTDSLTKLGIGRRELFSSASYVQADGAVLQTFVAESLRSLGVTMMPLHEALGRIGGYYWGLIDVDEDKYTALAELSGQGVYIKIPRDVHVKAPIYTCFMISTANIAQPVHNLVVVEDGAELNLVTACSSSAAGLHVGVTELYVGAGAKVTYTMIHNWAEGTHSRPRTGARLADGSRLDMYYVNLNPGASLQTMPTVEIGARSSFYSASVLLASGSSSLDVGTSAMVSGEGGRAEIISKIIARDTSDVVSRTEILARAPGTRGHTECSGLMLSDEASIRTIPALESRSPTAELSHEAAIGMVDEEAISYLMARGLSDDEAIALLVRGFAIIELGELPLPVEKSLRSALRALAIKATG